MYTTTMIKKIARLLEKSANQLLKPYQITHGYTYFLLALYEQEGLTQTQLQRLIGIEHPTVVRTLDRMARDDLIERHTNPSDRRAFQIYLTEKGKACKPCVLEAAEVLNKRLLETFTEEERLVFDALLKRLIENLESEPSI